MKVDKLTNENYGNENFDRLIRHGGIDMKFVALFFFFGCFFILCLFHCALLCMSFLFVCAFKFPGIKLMNCVQSGMVQL